MPKLKPDGMKIAQLRKAKGLKQFGFAASVGISERKLRNIETQDLLIETHQLQEIAEKLGTEMNIIMKPSQSAQHVLITPPEDGQIRLRAINNAAELFRLMMIGDCLDYKVIVEFNSSQLKLMIDLLRIAKSLTTKGDIYDDGYIDHEFASLHRIARIREILDELRSADIGVAANRYYRTCCSSADDPPRSERVFALAFVPASTTALNVARLPDVDVGDNDPF